MAEEPVLGYFRSSVATDLLRLVVGFEPMASGLYREVYPCKLRPELVVKFELGAGNFQNVEEWNTWNDLDDMPAARRWLAPCEYISPCGSILLQRRTTPVTIDQMPRTVPRMFTDLKVQNFGMLDGRLVCHDYGLHRIRWKGADKEGLRRVKADWWSVDAS